MVRFSGVEGLENRMSCLQKHNRPREEFAEKLKGELEAVLTFK